MDDQFQNPPQRGDYLPPPPPPMYQVTSDIPPSSPYHQSPQPRSSSNRQTAGWLTGIGAALLAFFKYGGILLLKLPAVATLLSAAVSFFGYALFFGPWSALSLVVMIFIHEMGHVLEIRRQGMQATAPIFIPFMGAAIFQRSNPTTPVKQAQIGIAGPIAGTIGATASFFLYFSTGQQIFMLAALIGFGLNLLNLLPIWQLDGAWILAPVSKWMFVIGYGLGFIAFLWSHSWLLLIVLLFGISSLAQRFRTADSPYYASVPTSARWALGAAWLGLVGYLAVMTAQAYAVINPFVQ